MAASLFLLSRIASRGTLLGLIGAAGALFVFTLGWESLRAPGAPAPAGGETPRSFRRGVVVNFLSPHPYLFWLTVGGPITWQAADAGWGSVAAFVGTFYALLVGSKVLVALAAGRGRSLLGGRGYRCVLRALGLALCLLAAMLLRDSLALLL